LNRRLVKFDSQHDIPTPLKQYIQKILISFWHVHATITAYIQLLAHRGI